MSYEECEKIYAEVVILIEKRLVKLIDVTVEQWLDLKYENHKTMDKNIKKWVIGTWLIRSYKRKFKEYLEIKRQRETYAREVDMEYNPSNLVFAEWLTSKFYNHLEMDWYTKNTLWVYWMRGDDEVILNDEEVLDLKDKNNNDKHEIANIFRIETNLFDYETPLCTEFKKFNYLLKVNAELFSYDIERTKTFKDYENELNNEDNEPWPENRVPYEICDHVCEPFCFKYRKTKWPTYNLSEDRFCNGGELPGMV
uniref:C2 calcium/lipid-binding domain, CaLB n=1 Tax=Tanacetum cinerariifolium TaxID=118510 RepID=A0A699GN25_TANCI|nr:C2 calcium/lipid-binding domain, CaLB [Tanacetum cinerariifolium]